MVFLNFKKVRSIMQKRVQNIDENETIAQAIEKMNFFRISCLIVTRKGAPIGILTERDMINRVLSKHKDPKKTKSKDVMTTPIVSKSPNFPLYKLVKIMNEYMIRHVPIIQEDKIIGIITQTDIVKFTEKSSNIKYMIQYLTIVILLLLLIFMR